MRYSLLLFLFVGVGSLMAQYPSATSTPAAVSARRFSIGVAFAPEFAFRTLQVTERNETTEAIVAFRNELETFRFGNTTGITVNYAFNDHWSVGSGIGHTVKGYRTKMADANSLTFGDQIVPRRGFNYQTDDVALPERYGFVYTFTYLCVPLQLNYSAGKGKWRSISSIGLNVESLISATTTFRVKYKDSSWERKKNETPAAFEKLSLSPMISTGVSRQLGQRWLVTMAPVARYGVLRIIDAPITARLWSVGLNVGCSYRL